MALPKAQSSENPTPHSKEAEQLEVVEQPKEPKDSEDAEHPKEFHHQYLFKVEMNCSSCSTAVGKVLTALKKNVDIKSFDVALHPDLKARREAGVPPPSIVGTVNVYTGEFVSYETVLERIKKTQKKVVSGTADGVNMEI
ncbi:MAG: Cytosolic copper metallochaperone [Cirrosporium novae-zelandiae]|nr:MAG: Cytosolic copper metallochaperone [Cirrosporium novae-zelandiae]